MQRDAPSPRGAPLAPGDREAATFDAELAVVERKVHELRSRPDVDGAARPAAAEAFSELAAVIAALRGRYAELQADRAALAAEREHYRELFEVMPDGYAVTDDGGVVREANATLCSLLDRPHHQLVGKPLGWFISDEHRAAFSERLAHMVQAGRDGHFTIKLAVRDGVEVPVVLRAALVSSADGAVIKWLFHDRRDELRTDQLRASEERLRALLDSAAVGVVLCDAEGELVYTNKYAARLLHDDRAPDGRQTWVEVTHPADLTRVARTVRHAYEEGRASAARHRLADRDGAPCWVDHSVVPFIDPDGRVNGYVSTLVDVTAEHLATVQVQESREFTDAVVNNVGALVVVLDPDHTVRQVNRPVSVLTGYTEAELLGRNVLHSLVPAEQRDAVQRVLVDLTVTGSNTFENDWLMADGRRRRLLWTNTTLTAPDGAIRALVGTGVDVTEQRRFEAQLAQADRLSAVGRLAAGLAHDVNNTLTVLGLRMERLRGRHGDDPASIGDLDSMQRSVEHTQALIADLQAFGSGHELRAAPVELNAAVRQMLALLQELLGSRIAVRYELTDEDTTTVIDRVRFDQAITNLAINARDAMAEGGTLTVTTAIGEAAGDARPVGMPAQLGPGRYVRLAIADTGSGIAPEALSHVFDPYFTTKALAKGTGLGLSVTYGTISQAGGAIVVDSELGRGTTFTIWLPQAAAG